MARLFRRRSRQAPPRPTVVVVPYGPAYNPALAHTLIFSEMVGGTYTKLEARDAFGTKVQYGPLA